MEKEKLIQELKDLDSANAELSDNDILKKYGKNANAGELKECIETATNLKYFLNCVKRRENNRQELKKNTDRNSKKKK